MPAKRTQKANPLQITTPLGADKLLISALQGVEGINRLYQFDVQLWSEDSNIKPTEIVGKHVGIKYTQASKEVRYFHGMVSRFRAGRTTEDLREYRARIVPDLWKTTQSRDHKIYQKKKQTAMDVVEEVLDLYGITDLDKTGVKDKFPEREYCVQYGESAFHFLSRLLEDIGVFYFFRHEKSKHVLVLGTAKATFKDNPTREAKIERISGELTRTRNWDNDHISKWEHRYQFRAGKWTTTDYDFVKQFPGTAPTPSDKLLATKDSTLKLDGASDIENFTYPGGYTVKADGKKVVERLTEAEDASYHHVLAAGHCINFAPGTTFTLKDHPCKTENDKEYLIRTVQHRLRTIQPFDYGIDSGSSTGYQNQFTCIPSDTPFRPQRKTARPQIAGNQTAVVVGKKGEEIWTDEHGRIQVQFFWDRDGKRDDKGLCWLRCVHPMAGKGWGSLFLPRVGQEVVVTFLDGNPERPLVTGVVYNGEQTTPYKLPAEASRSGVKTMTTKDGSAKTFNELRFDDKKDKEEIYFHAERDFQRIVENNDSLKVGQETKDQGDQTIDIYNNQTLNVGQDGCKEGSQKVTVWQNRTTTLKKGDDSLTLDEGDRTVKLTKGDLKATVSAGSREVTVKKDDKQTVQSGNRKVSVNSGNDELTIKSGNQTIKVSAGKSEITAGQEITLKVGANSIKIDNTGITIKGTKVDIQANATITVKASAMATVEGSASLTLKGGLVKIN